MPAPSEWYEPSRRAMHEVLDLFGPEGNIEDYWLGNPPHTNSFMGDNVGWRSVEVIVRAMRRREDDRYAPTDAMYESLMRHDYERGGGNIGLEPAYDFYLSNFLRVGERALAEERSVNEHARNRGRT